MNSPELIVETFVKHENDSINGPAFYLDRIAEYSSSIFELSLVHEKSLESIQDSRQRKRTAYCETSKQLKVLKPVEPV